MRIFIILIMLISGCANFNPRNDQRIRNNGEIEDIRNNQNGVMAEVGKLRQEAQIQNSKLDEVQNGLVNLNSSLSRNENSGIQILQGDGALILVFSLAVIGMMLYWYRDRAITSEKNVSLMTREIARFNHPNLNDNILKAAMIEKNEHQIYGLLKKGREEFKTFKTDF